MTTFGLHFLTIFQFARNQCLELHQTVETGFFLFFFVFFFSSLFSKTPFIYLFEVIGMLWKAAPQHVVMESISVS